MKWQASVDYNNLVKLSKILFYLFDFDFDEMALFLNLDLDMEKANVDTNIQRQAHKNRYPYTRIVNNR